jgi:hypothetical protein
VIAVKDNIQHRRMGVAAPVAPSQLAAPASIDFSTLGNTKDESAKTPPVKPFPSQGEALRQDGEYYIYRGFGGVPFRSKSKTAPDIKARDPRQPVVTADAHTRIFDLSDPTDLQAYTEIWDKATKGFYVPPVEERQWIPEKQTWKVFMRWGVKYWELPEE